MKLWSMLAGVAVAGMLVSSGIAQQPDAGGGRAGRGRGGAGGGFGAMFQAPPAYDKIVAAGVGLSDGDAVTAKTLAAYLKKNLSADATDAAKKAVSVNAVSMMARIVSAAGKDPLETTSLGKDDYTTGLSKMPARGQGGGRRGGGGGGNRGGGTAPQA